jgi:hypothetical protein
VSVHSAITGLIAEEIRATGPKAQAKAAKRTQALALVEDFRAQKALDRTETLATIETELRAANTTRAQKVLATVAKAQEWQVSAGALRAAGITPTPALIEDFIKSS